MTEEEVTQKDLNPEEIHLNQTILLFNPDTWAFEPFKIKTIYVFSQIIEIASWGRGFVKEYREEDVFAE